MPIQLLQSLGCLCRSSSSIAQLLPAVSCMLNTAHLSASAVSRATLSTTAPLPTPVQSKATSSPLHISQLPPAPTFSLITFASSAARVRAMGTGNGPLDRGQDELKITAIGFPFLHMSQEDRKEQRRQLQTAEMRLASDFTAAASRYDTLMKQLEKGNQQVLAGAQQQGLETMHTAQELIEVKAQQEDWEGITALARKALHIAKAWHEHQLAFEFRHALATAQHNLGQHEQALELWRTQLTEQEERNSKVQGGTEEYALTLRGKAASLLLAGDAAQALQVMDVCETFYREKYGKDTLYLMYPYDVIGCAFWVLAHDASDGPDQKLLQRAANFLHAAWQLRREIQTTDHPDYLVTLRNYAEVNMKLAQEDASVYSNSEILWREQINVWRRKENGQNSSMTVTSMLGWADCLRNKEHAVKAYDLAITTLQGAQGSLKKYDFSEASWESCMRRAVEGKEMAEAGEPHRGGPWFPPSLSNLTLKPNYTLCY